MLKKTLKCHHRGLFIIKSGYSHEMYVLKISFYFARNIFVVYVGCINVNEVKQ